MKAKIHLQKIKAQTLIGVHREEQESKQLLFIDLSFELDISESSKKDLLISTVDYSALTQTLLAYLERSSCHLLETLAARLADYLLEKFPLLSIHLRIYKPQALKDLAEVSIEYFKSACLLSPSFSNIVQEGDE